MPRSLAGKAVKAAISERWRKANPERSREIRRLAAVRWRNNHPDANKRADRAKHLKAKYGLSIEDWNAMFAAQGFVCASCSSPHAGVRWWPVDHCHKTNRIRGILCNRCNVALGYVEDEPLMTNLRAYLENTQ